MKKELQKRLKNFDVDIDLVLFAAVNKRVYDLNVFAIGQEDFFDNVLRWKDNEMEKFLFENPEIKQKLLRKKREKERRRRRRIKQMKIEIEKQKHIENCEKLRPIRH